MTKQEVRKKAIEISNGDRIKKCCVVRKRKSFEYNIRYCYDGERLTIPKGWVLVETYIKGRKL